MRTLEVGNTLKLLVKFNYIIIMLVIMTSVVFDKAKF